MTGTPSQWQGRAREVLVRRKPAAKLRSEEHESHEACHRGRDCVGSRSPMSSGNGGAYMRRKWSEGHVPYPGKLWQSLVGFGL